MAEADYQEILEQLVEMADGVASDYMWSFLARAEDDYDYFFGIKTDVTGIPESDEEKFAESRQFGKLWEGKDYAFRVLMNQKHRDRVKAELVKADKFRNEHPKHGLKPLNLTPAHFRLFDEVVDRLARQQDPQRLMETDYDSGFWEDFSGEFAFYLDSGEISDRN